MPFVRPEDLGSMRQGRQYVIAQKFMLHPIKSAPQLAIRHPSNQETMGISKPLCSCHSWWLGDHGNRSAAGKVWIAEGQLPVPRGLELCAIEKLGADKIGAGEVGGIED